MAYQTRYNSKGEKLYPFSMIKNGHNIEYCYNKQWIICREMEDGEREWDDKAFENLDDLEEIYGKAISCPIYWATGKEYAKLRDWAMYAEISRDEAQYRIKERL